MNTEPHRWSAIRNRAAIKKGDISPSRLLESCLSRIAKRDAVVQAWEYLHPGIPDQQPINEKPGAGTGKLFGIPVAIKDIIDTGDMPTGYGSPIFENHRPATDADCVSRLRKSGAVILGKTVTTEFAYLAPGKTRNPHNPEHSPGGSSSGSAAAVADFQVPLALGTQTAGSIIRPASYCGVVGFKPSFASFSTAGIHPFAPSLDTLGGFARCVDDIGLLCSALGDYDMDVLAGKPGKIALVRGPDWASAETASHSLLEDFEKYFAVSTVNWEALELQGPFLQLTEAQKQIQLGECTRSLSEYYQHSRDKLSDKLLADYEYGLQLEKEALDNAYAVVDVCRNRIAEIFNDFDLIITPASTGKAPAGLDSTGDPVFNRMWTALGLPCLSLPVLQPEGELPLGVQLVGAFGEDQRLLCHGSWMETLLSDYRSSL